MSLPQVQTLEHELTLPSTKDKVKYRPFAVGEEKLLLMALESKDEKQMIDALRQIIDVCTFNKLDVNKMPSFDLEYVFLQLRAKSVGEIITLKVRSEVDDTKTIDVEVDLNDVQVFYTEGHENTIDLDGTVGVRMRYPVFEDIQKYNDIDNQLELGIAIIKDCMVSVYDKDSVYPLADEAEEEINKFVDGLGKDHFKKIVKFFDTMPKLQHTIKYNDPYVEGDDKERELTIEGLKSFFL